MRESTREGGGEGENQRGRERTREGGREGENQRGEQRKRVEGESCKEKKDHNSIINKESSVYSAFKDLRILLSAPSLPRRHGVALAEKGKQAGEAASLLFFQICLKSNML